MNLYGLSAADKVNAPPSGMEPAGVKFLDGDLREEAKSFSPVELRALAKVYESWAAQCRFKARVGSGIEPSRRRSAARRGS